MDKQRIRTFLIGGAAGIVAGILLAPRSGRELRGNISNRAGEARERGRERYFDVGERMQERISRARDGGPARPANDDEIDFEAVVTVGESPASGGEWPPLRDVSRDAPATPTPESDPFADVAETDEGGIYEGPASRSEELRRKVQETRARLDEKRGETVEGEDDTL